MKIKRAPRFGAIRNTLTTIIMMVIIGIMTGCSTNTATVEETKDSAVIKTEQVEEQQLIENTEEETSKEAEIVVDTSAQKVEQEPTVKPTATPYVKPNTTPKPTLAPTVTPKATPVATPLATPKTTPEIVQEVTTEVIPDVQPEENVAPVETAPSTNNTNLGNFKISAYCHCSKCCGKSDGITATGTKVTANRTVAVDPNVIPLGSQVVIDGKTYVAEDTGGAIKGNRIDMYFSTHQEALNWGIQYKDVSVIR